MDNIFDDDFLSEEAGRHHKEFVNPNTLALLGTINNLAYKSLNGFIRKEVIKGQEGYVGKNTFDNSIVYDEEGKIWVDFLCTIDDTFRYRFDDETPVKIRVREEDDDVWAEIELPLYAMPCGGAIIIRNGRWYVI